MAMRTIENVMKRVVIIAVATPNRYSGYDLLADAFVGGYGRGFAAALAVL